jgi:aminoglycoside phosphotransferase (APT) family kinase protein
MSSVFARKLDLIRSACADLRPLCDTPDAAATLDQIGQALAKLIVDANTLPNLRAAAVRGFGALDADVRATTDWDTACRVIDARLARTDLASSSAAVDFVRSVLHIDHRYWQEYEAVLQTELARTMPAPAAPVAGPNVDREALSGFLRAAIPGEEMVSVRDVRLASIGSSKSTLLVDLAGNRRLPAEIVVRMDQAFNFLETTVLDEYPALQLLFAHGVPVPEPYALEPTGEVLGGAFIVCSRVAGRTLGTSYFPPPRNDAVTRSLAACLAKIHAVPVDHLASIGRERKLARSYIEDEVLRHYATWRALDITCPTVEAAFAWVRANLSSAHGRRTIVHNDFNYHNILIDDDRVTAVLDWEFVHLGNPASDLGYFAEVAERGSGFDFFLQEYARAGGRLPRRDELDFYILWGHTRFAIMNFQVKTAIERGDLASLRYLMADVHYMQKPTICIGEKLGELLNQQ